MTVETAVVSDLNLKEAVCPTCGSGRLFYETNPPNPVMRPLAVSHKDFDLLSGESSTGEFLATSATFKLVKLDGAGWTKNEHKGKTLLHLDGAGGKVLEKLDIHSNTEDTLKVRGRFLFTTRVSTEKKVGPPFPTPPHLAFKDATLDRTIDRVESEIFDNRRFACITCDAILEIP